MSTEISEQTGVEVSPETDEILAALDDRGYAVIPSVISPDEADEAREVLEGFLRAEMKESHRTGKAQRVGRIAVKHPIFLELMCHPVIVDIWKRWLGPDMICSTWTGNTYYPGHDRIGWHADYPYWALQLPWPTGNFTGQTIWMLDDFREENGATGVVPYSQRLLRPPDNADAWRDDGVVLTGVRGSVAVLHGAMWHTGRPNTTDKPRSCLLGMYIRPHCLPMEHMRGQLAEIEHPSELAKQLLGANQRQPGDVEG